MTTYNAVPDANIDPEQPIRSIDIKRLRDNPLAMFEGAAGAPRLQAGALDDGAVDTEGRLASGIVSQGKLKTDTGTFGPGTSAPMSSGGETRKRFGPYVMPGGHYGFAPTIAWSGANVTDAEIECVVGDYQASASSRSDTALALVYQSSTGSGDTSWGATMTQYYVLASPPYDLGDGPVQQFVFLDLDATGNVIGHYAAPEAPWHYNGPTKIRAERVDTATGRKYRRMHPLVAEFNSMDAARARLSRADFIRRLTEPLIDAEITQAVKQADMPLLPHPFGRPLGTVVLLDPVSPIMAQLAALQNEGLTVQQLVADGYLEFGNTALPRKTPPGVMAVSVAWKLTG